MDSFSELVKLRESCRDYDLSKPVENEKLRAIIEAAVLAPSACNSQPWHFTVVNSKEKSPLLANAIQKLGSNKFTAECPSFIVINEENANISAKIGGRFLDQHFAGNDIGIAAAHIVLAARDLGLSTCILGMFDEGKVRELCGIGKNKRIRLIISVGYAKTDKLREKKRKPSDETVTFICD